MSHVKTARDVSREDACDECTCERLWSRRLTWVSSWASKEKANWGVYLPNDRFRNRRCAQSMRYGVHVQGMPAPLLPCPHPFPAASAPPTVPHLLHLLTCLRYRACMPRVCKRHLAHACKQGSTRNVCVGVEAVRMGAQSVRMSVGIPRVCV